MRWVRPAAVALVVLFAAVPASLAVADDSGLPPDGTVTPLPGTVPNYFNAADPATNPAYCPLNCPVNPPSKSAVVFADPGNHLLFETDVALQAPSYLHCPPGVSMPLLALDADTYRPLAYGCGGDRPTGATGGASTDEPLVAVDPVDRLLFFSGGESTQGPLDTTPDTIVAISEATLKPVASWTLPSTTAGGATAGAPAPPSVLGLAWQASGDRLVVETGYSTYFVSPIVSQKTGPPVGVDVAIYDVGSMLASVSSQATAVAAAPVNPQYPYAVPDCAYTMLASWFASDNPLLSEDGQYLFVPCYTQGSAYGGGGLAAVAPAAINRLTLSALAPTGDSVVTPLPGNQDGDVVFDPGSDRAFVPVQTNSGTIVYVYSGTEARLVGENAVVSEPPGQPNPDFNCVDFAFDQDTGRVYGLAPSGLFFFDGRRTPVGGGQSFDDMAAYVQYETDVVLPRDSVYPYTRVILGRLTPLSSDRSGNPCSGSSIGWGEQDFEVFADRTAVTSDTGNGQVDDATYDGAIPAGYSVSYAYGANGSGSGAHVDWAGSYGGVDNNISDGSFVNGDFLPFGGGNRDLLAGWVEQSTLSNGSATATATGVGDGNSATTGGLAACTDASAPDGCPHPPPPDGVPAPPSGGSGGSSTAQAWPFGTAACPVPTDNGLAQQGSATGFSYTTGYDQNNEPQQQAVPGSDQLVTAQVDCDPKSIPGGVTATASAHVLDSAAPSGPSIHIASASSHAEQTPAVNGGPAISTVTAVARGVRLDSGDGSSLEIGFVEQTAIATAAGRPGTASATRSLVLGEVSVTRPGSDPQVICAAICTGDPQAVIKQVDAALPATLQVTVPEPDQPFAPGTGIGTDTETVPGSPGGYEALLQPPVSDQSTSAALFGFPASDGETALLPALRVLVTPPAANNYQLDYLVVDLAPVEADAREGVTVSCPDGSYAPDPNLPLNCVQFPTGGGGNGGGQTGGGTAGTPGTPGTPGTYIPGSKGHFVPGVMGHFVPGTPAIPGTPGHFVPAQVNAASPLTTALLQPQQPPLLAGGVGHLLKRVFKGFRLLARSPAEAAKFFGLIVLMTLPVLIAARRRQWLRAIEGV